MFFVLRTFYNEMNSHDLSTGPAILESFCHSLVRDKDKWNQYQTYLLNMEQGQRILSQYGGTFFQVHVYMYMYVCACTHYMLLLNTSTYTVNGALKNCGL